MAQVESQPRRLTAICQPGLSTWFQGEYELVGRTFRIPGQNSTQESPAHHELIAPLFETEQLGPLYFLSAESPFQSLNG
jgi:hypothetical protein